MQKYYDLTDKLWRELCVIPSPSHHEEKRAKYICDMITSWGIKAEIDEAKNVLVKLDGETPEMIVFEAHTDVVFPDMDALPFSEDEKNVYCPGCGDDTAEVAMLMSTLKYITDSGKKSKYTVLIALNSCEEGLGNRKGTKAIMKRYGDVIKELYTFDGTYDEIVNVSVGAHRYKVTVETEGGHAFTRFGNKNAAAILARGISKIYEINAPQDKGRSSYNVGIISGGTSVNSICQKAEMICEYRSTSAESILYLKEKFYEVFDYMRSLGATVTPELLGDIPCMKGVDEKRMREITEFCKGIQEKYSGITAVECAGSTDCNIPHSVGIPAVCVGTYMGDKVHTREEWAEKASIPKGFDIVREVVLQFFN